MHIYRVIYFSLCILALIPASVIAVELSSADMAAMDRRPTIVYQACMDNQGMVTRYDCRCLKQKFSTELEAELKKPEHVPSSKPGAGFKHSGHRNTQTQVLVIRIMNRGECRSEKAFARHNQNECERGFHRTKKLSNLPEDTDKEQYCACIGKTVGELFVNDPNGEIAASSRGERRYRSLAASQCRSVN
jgi:hypothetical protein